MEGFVVDLDKVLDDFERSEGSGGGGAPATRTESKSLRGSSLPTLQPPAAAGAVYVSPQVAGLPPPAYTPSVSLPSYSQAMSYPSQYESRYQKGYCANLNYATVPPHNDVIGASAQTDGIIGMKVPVSNGQAVTYGLESPAAAGGRSDDDGGNGQPWMAGYQAATQTFAHSTYPPEVYTLEGGVLAHGERSDGELMRQLNDDRPELLQSMAKPVKPPHYTGEALGNGGGGSSRGQVNSSGDESITNGQPYPGVTPVSRQHPDVVPMLVGAMADVARSTDHPEVANGTEVQGPALGAPTDPEPPKNGPQLVTNGDMVAGSPEHSQPVSLSPEPALPAPAVDAMSVDSPPHSLQSDASTVSLERMTDGATITVSDTHDNSIDQLEKGAQPATVSIHEADLAEPERPMQTDTEDSDVPIEKATATVTGDEEMTAMVEPGISQAASVAVGFCGSDDADIEEDEMNAYLAELEKSGTFEKPSAPSGGRVEEEALVEKTPCSNSSHMEDTDSGRTEVKVEEKEEQEEATTAGRQSPSSVPPSSECQVPTERRGSGGSVEKFLAAAIMSPSIVTPREDPGFSKVPGFIPTESMSSLQEDSWEVSDVQEKSEESHSTELQTTQVSHSSGTTDGGSGTDAKTRVENMGGENVGTSRVAVGGNNVMEVERDSVMVDKNKREEIPKVTPGAVTISLPIQKPHPVDSSSDETGNSLAGTGARPKDSSTQRKSRPNSLLGLSKPDLNIAIPVVSPKLESRDTGFGEPPESARNHNTSPGITLPQPDGMVRNNLVENSHDIINRQLAQKARSPLEKKQLNLEIKQHLDNAAAQRQMESRSLESHGQLPDETQAPGLVSSSSNPAAACSVSVVTNRAQLASGIGMNLPVDGSPMRRPDLGILEDIASSSSSSSLQSMQTQSPARVPPSGVPSSAAYHSPSATVVSNGHPQVAQYQEQLEQQLQQQQQPEDQQEQVGVAQGESEDNTQSTKLKRPTSLSLMSRIDLDVSQEKDSTEEDVAATGDAGHASSGSSSGHLTPYTQENGVNDPPGATASGPGADLMYSPPEVGPGAFSPAPRGSSNVNVVITQLGRVAPRWVPDAEACNCMQCEARFTFTKRRHHCRACGKVFCSACCNLKCKLQYMDNKEARVCSKCYQDIVRAQAYERMHSPSRSPNPNNPAEYCSTIPPLQQAAASLNAPPPTVMVPVGVLRKEGSQRSREPKQVMFSDGIRPGGDLTELDGSDARLPLRRHSRSSKKVERTAAAEGVADTAAKSSGSKVRVKRLSEPSVRNACLIPDSGLPPVIMSTGIKGDFTLEEDPTPESILPKIRSSEDPNPVVFAINKNLFVLVKIVNLDCCVNRVCWCFSTKGMCTVGQAEVVIVLECLPDEKTVPRDIFCHLNSVYDEASKGNTVSHLGHTIFGQSFLDSRDHCGFLYVRPTFQCVQKLLLPSPPYVFGLLLQKWETPWAKVFPVRLMLRLGAEYRYYPCPLISVRFRKPVYGEIGHTIMNLLADFRKYQYMLPQIRGVVIHMEEKKTYINFPRNRYDEVMKVVTNSNDHVMAMGANFSTDADSHLVCIQNDDGNYQTQAINIQNKPRKVTGASFVVFNGALKTSSGLRAKSSIVEDGLMVQISTESMGQLKAAMLDMRDYSIGCGPLDAVEPDEQVIVRWTEDDHKVNQGVKSPIDALPMDGIESIHIHNGTDYVGESRTIRWTEVFFIQNEDASNSRCEPVDLSRLGETVAQACCLALTPHLDQLKEAGLTKIGLRCTIDRDRVGYEVGSNGERLPDFCMNDLDNELIPVIHNAGTQSQDGPVVLELIFYIIE